jgi:hypothetical protein
MLHQAIACRRSFSTRSIAMGYPPDLPFLHVACYISIHGHQAHRPVAAQTVAQLLDNDRGWGDKTAVIEYRISEERDMVQGRLLNPAF